MDIAWKEDPGIGKQRSWRVVFSDGVMRIGRSRFDRKSGRWVGEVDVAIRPEDVLSVKFKTIDDSPIFPSDYHLDMKYRNPRDGSKAKVEWPLSYPDEETLGALLGGLEGFVESSKQQNVSNLQMRELTKYASRAEEDARQAADERRKDEGFEPRQDDVSNMVERGRLDELGCDEQKLSALLPGTSVEIVVEVIVLGICILFFLCGPVLHTTLDVLFLVFCLLTILFALFARVAGWLVERSKKLSWRLKGQHVILNADGVMLLVNDREGEEVGCWYTEDCGEPLRITRIDGYEVKRKRVVLRGSFSEGRMDPASGSYIPGDDGNRVDELEIYRIYSDEDERRLLDKLDTLVAHSVDQPW